MAEEGPKQKSWECARDLSYGCWAGGVQRQTSPTALAKTEGGLQPPD